jgi:hypothetical protein
MSSKRKQLWLVVGFVALAALATLIKHLINTVNESLDEFYRSPRSNSVASAREQGILVATFQTDPVKLTADGKTFEFDEAWLEAGYALSHRLVWFSYDRRLDWNWLCVRPKTHWYQNTFSYGVSPEYPYALPEDRSPGVIRDWVLMGGGGNNQYCQKVPLDLRELKLTAGFSVYGADKGRPMGTVRLTTED